MVFAEMGTLQTVREDGRETQGNDRTRRLLMGHGMSVLVRLTDSHHQGHIDDDGKALCGTKAKVLALFPLSLFRQPLRYKCKKCARLDSQAISTVQHQ